MMVLGVLLWQPRTQQQHTACFLPTQNQRQKAKANFLMVTTQGVTAWAINIIHTRGRLPLGSPKSFPPNS